MKNIVFRQLFSTENELSIAKLQTDDIEVVT